MAARDLLKAGLRKSIGSGGNTVVWRDHWLPVCPPRPPSSLGGYKDPYLLVYHLIDHNTKTWKDDILKRLFTEEDVKWIKCIKPSRLHQADKFVWAYSKSGIYSVKTGYMLASTLKENAGPLQVLEPSTNSLKHKIWSLKTSRKIKHSLWQTTAACLPVRSRLVERHCGTDRSCPRCDAEEESINHCLFECPAAAEVWNLSDIPVNPGCFPCDAIYRNIDHLLWRAREMQVPEKTIGSFPWIIWYIWKARNEKVFNNKDIPPIDTIQLAMAESEAWLSAQSVEQAINEDHETGTSDSHEEVEIHLPRCQVDASWGMDSHTCGGGFILEREDGSRYFGATSMVQVLTPLHAELAALLWAMKAILHMGITSMTFESDCLQLVKLIEDEEIWPSLANEFDEFYLMYSFFNSFSISFIPRLRNVRADCLSK